MTATPNRPPVPLAVWPAAHTSTTPQDGARCRAHYPSGPGGRLTPELARRIITEYSDPGDIVVDPYAGAGPVVTEAAQAGRRAVGVERTARQAARADTTLTTALTASCRREVTVVVGDPRHLARLLRPTTGHADLVIAAATHAQGVGGRPVGVTERAMAALFAGCFEVLRPGGLLAVVTQTARVDGRTVDWAGRSVALGQAAGFAYLQHVIALTAPIHDGHLDPPPPFGPTSPMTGEPFHRVVHHDVTVLLRPDTPPTRSIPAQPTPARPAPALGEKEIADAR